MEYTPYLYRQGQWPFKIIYNSYQEKYYSKAGEPEKLFIIKNNELIIQSMWRMQVLGELHGKIWVLSYTDNTNYELYDEMLWSCNSSEEVEECHSSYYSPDDFDYYFERLAEVAAEIGCERAEIKCLVKSLILKYRFDRVRSIEEFPFEEFNKLYSRLISSKDTEQLRVAERLSRYHVKQLEEFLQNDVSDKIMRASWIREEK